MSGSGAPNKSAILERVAQQRAILARERGNADANPPLALRLSELRRVCRAGMRLLAMHDDAERVLWHRDPLPASTERALERLRRDRSRPRRGS